VQNHGKRWFATEVAGIERKGAQCAGSGAKEKTKEKITVEADQRVERMGQGEHDVEVRNRQEHRLLGGHPPRPLLALAFGAVTVAAGVVGDAFVPAGIAALHMPAQLRGPTASNRAQHGPLLA